MIKEILSNVDLALLGEVMLILFFGVFVVVSLWALLRPRQQSRGWAELALHDPTDALGHEDSAAGTQPAGGEQP